MKIIEWYEITNHIVTLMDVLNFVAIFGREFCELFDKFSPSSIMIDPDTGMFNTDFLPDKDTILGLETLFNM